MTGYRLSRFAVALPVQGREEEPTAVYSTLTRAFFVMPKQRWSAILAAGPGVDPADVEELIQNGILIKEGVDETSVFEQWRNRQVHDFSAMKSKVLVTRRCNNRCTYCIIAPEAETMSGDTARAMDDFYLGQIHARRPRAVRDDYLGGEPLLHPDLIRESASRRFYFCRGRGIDYAFSITTNGTLVTPAIVTGLSSGGLTSVRVSLAGPADVHDKLRPSAGGGGTYEKIMRNLEKISGSIPVSVECQYDADGSGFRRIPEMLDDLNRRKIRVAAIVFTPILAGRSANGFNAGMGAPAKYQFLTRAAAERGFSEDPAPPSNACMADFRSNFVFDTDGSIIPCPSLQGGEMAYGHVAEGIDFVAESQLRPRHLPDRCLNQCELLPLCMGGCRLQALIRSGDFNGIDCPYDYYRTLLQIFIGQKAAAALSRQGGSEEGETS